MMPKPIPVLLVDDSPVCLTILKRMVSESPFVEVVGTAKNGKEALDLVPRLNPKVICTDLEMPIMDGLQLTKEIMERFPRPILVVSDYVQTENQQNIFQLLDAGAIDVFPKPRGGNTSDYLAQAHLLIAKIQVLSGVVVIPRRASSPQNHCTLPFSTSSIRGKSKRRIIVIGASTGGPQALKVILSRLPENFPLPIICVQHLTDGFLKGLIDWLSSHSPLKICIAQDHEVPRKGTVYFPQEGKHLQLTAKGQFSHSLDPLVSGHRPSVDVTFCSVSKVFGHSAVGILLTGMGQDGAAGMKVIAQTGGKTIAQDEQSCVVFGMPKHAIDQGSIAHILPLHKIAELIMESVYTPERISSLDVAAR